jgi:hypothetical protein
MTAVVPRMASRQLCPQVSPRATTEWKTAMLPPSKLLLDRHRARHDAPPGARFARTAVYSAALYAMSSHIAKTVRHACNTASPWTIKGGAVPWPRGDEDGQHSLARFPPSPRYWHLASIKPQGSGGSSSSPTLLVAPLYRHHGATQYSATSTHLLDVRPWPEPG